MDSIAFFHKHLRSVTWSKEEEIDAMALIDDFKAGELPDGDLEDGAVSMYAV